MHLIGFEGVITGIENGVVLPGVSSFSSFLPSSLSSPSIEHHVLPLRSVVQHFNLWLTIHRVQADQEGTWLKDNLAYFKEQAEEYDDEPFQDLLQELKDRPDLKKLLD